MAVRSEVDGLVLRPCIAKLLPVVVLAACGGSSASDAAVDMPDMASDGAGSSPIVVFAIESDGALGGRSGADAACETERGMHGELVGLVARALVCITGPQELVDFPTSFAVPDDVPVVSLSGLRLAANWTAFLTLGLETSLEAASVLSVATDFAMGCGPQNAVGGCIHNCDGFASNDSGHFTCLAQSGAVHATWMRSGDVDTCDEVHSILCIAH
jgi:hypothetical protein